MITALRTHCSQINLVSPFLIYSLLFQLKVILLTSYNLYFLNSTQNLHYQHSYVCNSRFLPAADTNEKWNMLCVSYNRIAVMQTHTRKLKLFLPQLSARLAVCMPYRVISTVKLKQSEVSWNRLLLTF